MIRVGKESKLAPVEVIEKAISFFGPEGWGMEVEAQGDCCARFESSVGHVFVQTARLENGGGSKVDVEGREWDPQIKEFMGRI
jgi:hypothetical protein